MVYQLKILRGIIYISIFFSWLLFIPFYGPGQYLLTTIPEASYIFVLAHICGMLHSGWLYAVRPNNNLTRIMEKTAIALIPSAMLIILLSVSPGVELPAFVIMGYASAWFVIRWAWWLSLADHASYRGILMGTVLAVANILLFSYSALLYLESYALQVVLLSTVLCTAGAFLITTLPTGSDSERGCTELDLQIKRALPPWHLLVFVLFAFTGGGLLYSAVYTIEIDMTVQIRSLSLAVYVIGAILFGFLADRYSRIILLPGLFAAMGIGFILLIINSSIPAVYLALNSAILLGLGCADLYYWLMLAGHGRRQDIPFVFAVGLSFHLVVISLTGMAADRFLTDSSLWFSPAGVIGSIVMFLGILFSFWLYRRSLEMEASQPKPSPVFEHVTEEDLARQFGLTPREQEIALLLLKGYSYPQISEQLFISLNTVKYHVRNILRKADVSNRHELIRLIREGD